MRNRERRKVLYSAGIVLAVILFVLSLPALIGCLLMAGGALLLVPVALIALAWGILKACL